MTDTTEKLRERIEAAIPDAPAHQLDNAAHAVYAAHCDALRALLPAPNDAALREALAETLDALELFIPSPLCRDCADEGGTCPNSRSEKRPCDPHEAAEWARHVRDRASAALTAPSGEQWREAAAQEIEARAKNFRRVMCEQHLVDPLTWPHPDQNVMLAWARAQGMDMAADGVRSNLRTAPDAPTEGEG